MGKRGKINKQHDHNEWDLNDEAGTTDHGNAQESTLTYDECDLNDEAGTTDHGIQATPTVQEKRFAWLQCISV